MVACALLIAMHRQCFRGSSDGQCLSTPDVLPKQRDDSRLESGRSESTANNTRIRRIRIRRNAAAPVL